MTEAMMAAEFRGILERKALSAKCPRFRKIAGEVNCQQGRPDFIAARQRCPARTRRLIHEASHVIGRPSAAHLISNLKARAPRTRDYLVGQSHMTQSVVKRTLRELLEANMIRPAGPDSFVLSTVLSGYSPELWAFELKLSNWHRATFQALQNKSFAHYSTIVVPEASAHLIEKRADVLRHFGVGVLALDINSWRTRFLLTPKKNKPQSRYHYYYALAQFMLSAD